MQEYLDILVSIIVVFVSIINLYPYKLSRNNIIFSIITSEFLGILLLILTKDRFLVLLPVIVTSVTFLYVSGKNVLISIIVPLISILIGVISDMLVGFILIAIDINAFENDLICFVYSIIMVILAFALSKLIGTLLNKKLEISNIKFDKNSSLLVILSIILTFSIFYVNIILQNNNVSKTELALINAVCFIAYFSLLIIIMYILTKSISNDAEIKTNKLQLEYLQEYTQNLETLYSDMRAFRHDYINIISPLLGYIENKDMDGLEVYFNNNILPINVSIRSKNFKLGHLKNLKLPELKGIVSYKIIRAQELGVDVFIDIVEPIEKIDMNPLDLCRATGILIDNAIEAALNCTNPQVKIAFINKKNSVILVITNNYSGDIPSIDKIFQKGFSTKGKDRGLGLSNLEQITNNYENVFLDTLIEDTEFIQNLKITNL